MLGDFNSHCTVQCIRMLSLFCCQEILTDFPEPYCFEPISGWVDRASATETVHLGSIPGRVKPKTIKNSIYSFPAWRSAIKKDSVKPPRTGGQVAAWLRNRKVPSLSPDQGKFANKISLQFEKKILLCKSSLLMYFVFMPPYGFKTASHL